jgi:hypothetical protein
LSFLNGLNDILLFFPLASVPARARGARRKPALRPGLPA